MHRQTIVACFCNTKDRIATKNIDDEISTQGAYYKAGLFTYLINHSSGNTIFSMMHVVRTILLLLLPFLVQIPLLSSCYLLPYVRTYMFAYNIEFGMPVLSAKLDHNLIPNTSTGSTALLASCDILILYLGIKVTSFEFQLIQFSKNVE